MIRGYSDHAALNITGAFGARADLPQTSQDGRV